MNAVMQFSGKKIRGEARSAVMNHAMPKTRIFELHFLSQTLWVWLRLVQRSWLRNLRLWAKWPRITALTRFKITQLGLPRWVPIESPRATSYISE